MKVTIELEITGEAKDNPNFVGSKMESLIYPVADCKIFHDDVEQDLKSISMDIIRGGCKVYKTIKDII